MFRVHWALLISTSPKLTQGTHPASNPDDVPPAMNQISSRTHVPPAHPNPADLLVPKLQLRCAGTRNKPWIFDKGLDDVHPIVNRTSRSLSTIVAVRVVSACLLSILAGSELAEYCDTVSADLSRFEDVDKACFFWEVEFGEDIENGDVEGIKIV
ncbi:hypothetical protein DFH29DRAFT_998640 [Suillus ampliporus]|nr:hypothetical protein DFH29DRAFT_998640 [Suillus ampliporus]